MGELGRAAGIGVDLRDQAAVGNAYLLERRALADPVADRIVEALRISDIFRAKVVDSTLESFVFEITGTPEKLDAFADLMRPLGLAEVARTGVAALSRGR